MTFDELQLLEKQISAKREERERFNQQAVAAKVKAKALSEDIRKLEAQLPPPKQRRGITMKVEPATMKITPRKG